MTKKIKTIGLAVAVVLMLSAATVMSSCSKEDIGNDNGTPTPNETSSYWENDYRQQSLNGKVKTVKTFKGDNRYYDFLEFDNKGNLVKEYELRTDEPDYFSGKSMLYDTKDRLVKVLYGTDKDPQFNIVEFGYDGSYSHTIYFPTNFEFEKDMRLKKGITSFKWTEGEKLYLDLKCISISGNRMIFDGDVPIMGDVVQLEVEYKGSYPENIKFKDKSTGKTGTIQTKFGADGIPERLSFFTNGEEDMYYEYTSIAGFLLMTKYVPDPSDDPGRYAEYKYNDKGYLVSEKQLNGTEYRYEYEYDTQGNWKERTSERKNSNTNNWALSLRESREYTYW